MKILFITLSNIGDVVLTLPALDYLRKHFPEAKITVMVAKSPAEIFQNNPAIERLIVYDKHSGLKDKIGLFIGLIKERFDLVVDLRNSFFGALLPVRYRISPFLSLPKSIKHMQARYLYKVQSIKFKAKDVHFSDIAQKVLYIGPEEQKYIEASLEAVGIRPSDRLVVVSPGARSHTKRWGRDNFSDLCNQLLEDRSIRIALVGEASDKEIASYLNERSSGRLLDLVGETTILQLAALLKKASLLITNDSAVLHLGSYLDLPSLAIFGPTSELKYGPWTDRSGVVKRQIPCRPCQNAQCRFNSLECLTLIKPGDVSRRAKEILLYNSSPLFNRFGQVFRRILIVRTDRIGDVLLSTPAIKALRQNYPDAYIAMMVSPYTKEIVEENPYLDEVIEYDKDGKHRGWLETLGFALNLKKKRFDLVLILHPTNRAHLVAFLAGIPRRVGYNRKLGFLLTDRIKHTKQLGEKHELEYNHDLLKHLGIQPQDRSLFMPISQESGFWLEELLERQGIKKEDELLVIHSAASCPSKIWPAERFAEAADKLSEKYGFKIILVAGQKDIQKVKQVFLGIKHPVLDLSGKTSISQLASLLKRARLFISNDSGPVHIASAVGTPVISIFGRNQKGLSPKRWGPLGLKDRVLHKEVGCIECLAHNCKKEFACLKAISVDDVFAAAVDILG
ncbi:MAG: lipopolysaccharide heptosyltransferase II [Candidatus Omnitrophota bacterium]